MAKSQAPSSKFQRSSKLQSAAPVLNGSLTIRRNTLWRWRAVHPRFPDLDAPFWNLKFGASSAFALLRRDKLGFGAWDSELRPRTPLLAPIARQR